MKGRGLAPLMASIVLVAAALPAAGGGMAPRIRVDHPGTGVSSLEQNAVIRGRAWDDGNVRRILVSIDGHRPARATCRCPRPDVRWHFVLPELTFGSHELRIVAIDDQRREREVTRTIVIPEPSSPYRAFSDGSWWNTPFPPDAPVDGDSRRWIRRLIRKTDDAPLRLTGLPTSSPDQAQPVYFSTEDDPRYRIDPEVGPTVRIRIPRHAIASGASSPKMTVIDGTSDQGVGLVGAAHDDGSWTAVGLDRYWLSSEGLAEVIGGTEGNQGHRGATMVLKALRLEEVLLPPIRHRAQCFVPPALIDADPVWPMTGSDGDRPDGIPEGTVLRIRPSVDLSALRLSHDALTVARMLQDYGCAVTDGGAPHAVTLRLARADWRPTTLRRGSFSSLGWRDWEFVQGGYRP